MRVWVWIYTFIWTYTRLHVTGMSWHVWTVLCDTNILILLFFSHNKHAKPFPYARTWLSSLLLLFISSWWGASAWPTLAVQKPQHQEPWDFPQGHPFVRCQNLSPKQCRCVRLQTPTKSSFTLLQIAKCLINRTGEARSTQEKWKFIMASLLLRFYMEGWL